MTLLLELVLVAIAASGVVAAVALLPRARVMARPRGGPGAAPAPRPAQLVSLERLVPSAAASTVHTHAYLRPLLAEIADRRLAGRGWTLARIPEPAARDLLGERLWELIRPDRPFPHDRTERGVSAGELGRMLDALTRL